MKIAYATLLFLISLSLHSQTTHTVSYGDSLMTISFKFYGTHQCWKIIQNANPSLRLSDSIERDDVLSIPDFSNCNHPNREVSVWNSIIGNTAKPQIAAKIPSFLKTKKRKTIKVPPPIKKLGADRSSTKIKDKFVMYNSEGQKTRNNPELQNNNLIKVNKSLKNFTIQVGAFRTKREALFNKKKLELLGTAPYIEKAIVNTKKWFRLRVGSFPTLLQAEEYAKKKKIKKFTDNKFILVEL